MIEREAKLAADASFALPDLDGVVAGATAVPGSTKHLDATYYDGASRPLAAMGATVRHRVGEGAGRWTVKLPSTPADGYVARDEIDFELPAGPVPDPVRDAVAPHLGGEQLAPVARLVSERRRVEVRAGDGSDLAEVADDLVHVFAAGAAAPEAGAFREVEVELAQGVGDDVLTAIVGRLVAAGARPSDGAPKLVQALRLLGSAP